MLKIVHVSPTYFSSESFIGGGERYAEELSRVMSEKANVRFVSFGPRYVRQQITQTYERVILKSRTRDKLSPFSESLFRELKDADIIHCYQYFVLPTFLACIYGHLKKKKVFVSDLGGGGWTPGYHIDQSRWIIAHLPISQYAARNLPGRNKSYSVIYGGIDLSKYPMREKLEHDGSVVFLGRILPHKGIHFLIEGLPSNMPLRIIGPIGDEPYYAKLKALAGNKQVQFFHGLTDEEVKSLLRQAMALVHPTPVDKNGNAGGRELFGLAAVEAMASGCVPVLSNAASLPELIEDGVSGILIEPNKSRSIQNALGHLQVNSEFWRRLSIKARQRAETEYGWERVVKRCLHAYQGV